MAQVNVAPVGEVEVRVRVGRWTLHTALEGGMFVVRLGATSLTRAVGELAPKADVAAVIDKLAVAEGWTSKRVTDRWQLTRDDAVTTLVTAGGASVARLVPELLHAFEEAERVLAAFVLAVRAAAGPTRAPERAPRPAPAAPVDADGRTGSLMRSAAPVGRAQIEAALAQVKYNVSRACQILGLPRRTLYRRMKQYGIPLHREAVEMAGALPPPRKHNA